MSSLILHLRNMSKYESSQIQILLRLPAPYLSHTTHTRYGNLSQKWTNQHLYRALATVGALTLTRIHSMTPRPLALSFLLALLKNAVVLPLKTNALISEKI